MVDVIGTDKGMIGIKNDIHYKINVGIFLKRIRRNIHINSIELTFFCLIKINEITVNS